MERRTFLAVSAAALAGSAVAQQPLGAQVQAQPDAKIDAKLLRDDLDILRAALEEGHPGVHRYTPKPELDSIFKKANASIKEPSTALEFFRTATPCVSAVKCGHTRLRPAQEATDFFSKQPQFPFDVRVHANGRSGHRAFLFRDLAFDGKYAGREIVSINGKPAEQMLASLVAVANADGNSPTGRVSRAGQAFQQMLYYYFGIEPPYRISLRNASGNGTEVIETPGQSSEKLAAAMANYPEAKRGEIAEFRFLQGKDIAYLRIRGFSNDKAEDKPLPDFMDAKFTELASAGTKSLILDLRRNGGGADALARQLFSYLYDKPFRYYETLIANKLEFDFFKHVANARPLPADRFTKNANGRYDWTGHPNWGEMKPRDPHFAGKTFVLIDGGSFSATCEFAAQAHFHKVATFVGEETAGAYTGNTSGMGAQLVLPNSKCRISVPLCGYYMAVKTSKPDRGIFADVVAAPTIDDLLKGNDPVMDRALALAKG